jgi:hypothetical protein
MPKNATLMLEALIHQRLLGFEIDPDEGFIRFNFEGGYVELSGDDTMLYVELDEVN